MRIKQEVINFIYESYFENKDKLSSTKNDKYTRNPELAKEILNKLNNPEKQTKNIVVTGSKGKGSICRITNEILKRHKMKVGMFTSPHLLEYNERIKIDGKSIKDDDFIIQAKKVKKAYEEVKTNLNKKSYFGPIGIGMSIAMLYFNSKNTDINIFECGRGARFDEVGVLNADWSAIGKIFEEHIPELGESLKEVAENKSYVIKEGQRKCFSLNRDETVKQVLKKRAEEVNVDLSSFEENFKIFNLNVFKDKIEFDLKTEKAEYKNLEIPVLGEYNAHNAAVSIALCEEVLGVLNKNYLQEALSEMNWQGCTQIINKKPYIILDGGINRECARYLKDAVDKFESDFKVGIVGIPDTKDYIGVIEELYNSFDKLILTKPKSKHLKFTEEQFLKAKNLGYDIEYFEDCKKALNYSLNEIKKDGLLCICATQILLGEILVEVDNMRK